MAIRVKTSVKAAKKIGWFKSVRFGADSLVKRRNHIDRRLVWRGIVEISPTVSLKLLQGCATFRSPGAVDRPRVTANTLEFCLKRASQTYLTFIQSIEAALRVRIFWIKP